MSRPSLFVIAVLALACTMLPASAQDLSGSDAAILSDITAKSLERVNLIVGSFSVLFSILLIVMGFVVFGSLRELKADTKEFISVSVSSQLQNPEFVQARVGPLLDAAVRREFDQRLAALTKRYDELNVRFAISQLHELSSIIKSKPSFSNAERDEALGQLMALSEVEHLERNSQFVLALENIVDTFFGAGLRHQISQIEQEYDYVLAGNTRYVITLIQHYGIVVLGDVEPEKTDIDRLRHYIDICNKFKLFHIAQLYQVGLACKLSPDWYEIVRQYLQDADHFEQDTRETFFDRLQAYVDPMSFSQEPQGRHIRIAQLYASIVAAFPERFADPESPNDRSELH